MKLTKEFSEILGMFAADGCLQNDYICMWGNIYQDKDYYDKIVCPLFSQVFNKNIVAHEKKSNSVYGFYLCSKEVVKLFRELGFSNNKTYNVKIPQIILDSKDKKIYSAFIRGYSDCDGSINFLKRKGNYREFKTKYNTYPRVQIVSVSHKIIKQISYLLDELNIRHTSYKKEPIGVNERMAIEIAIRGPSRVKDFMKKVGFNNPAQMSKYHIWQEFGMCPTKITYEQRKLILQSQLDPFTIYSVNQ